MAINLEKGQKISLEKTAGTTLTRVFMGLGWGQKKVKKSGFLGFGAGESLEDVDLDASCLLYSGSQRVDQVWFRQLASQDGSIKHSGDDRRGGGQAAADNEQIAIDLAQLPSQVDTLIFTVNSFTGESFEGVPDAFCRLVDATGNREIARFNLTLEGQGNTGLVMAKLVRSGNDWQMQAIGEQGRGRTFEELAPIIDRHL
ncbi:MAG: TerD family protein [Candidatus Competibacteraceae bacterium]|nr:TerD family protein [Candidatus Competibacteraceae bacterium]